MGKTMPATARKPIRPTKLLDPNVTRMKRSPRKPGAVSQGTREMAKAKRTGKPDISHRAKIRNLKLTITNLEAQIEYLRGIGVKKEAIKSYNILLANARKRLKKLQEALEVSQKKYPQNRGKRRGKR